MYLPAFHYCDKIPDISTLKGRKVYFGSWFEISNHEMLCTCVEAEHHGLEAEVKQRCSSHESQEAERGVGVGKGVWSKIYRSKASPSDLLPTPTTYLLIAMNSSMDCSTDEVRHSLIYCLSTALPVGDQALTHEPLVGRFISRPNN
jgi:hypothetical protein